MAYEATICPGCGHSKIDSMDPQNEGAFDTVAVKCFACEDAQRVSHQMRKDNDGELYGYYWATTFSEGDGGE